MTARSTRVEELLRRRALASLRDELVSIIGDIEGIGSERVRVVESAGDPPIHQRIPPRLDGMTVARSGSTSFGDALNEVVLFARAADARTVALVPDCLHEGGSVICQVDAVRPILEAVARWDTNGVAAGSLSGQDWIFLDVLDPGFASAEIYRPRPLHGDTTF